MENHIPRILIACAASALLTACTYVSPASVRDLSQLSPLEVDPSGMALTVSLPEGVAIEPGSARLVLSATRSDTGEMVLTDAVLEQLRAGDQLLFRVAEADLPDLRDTQATARAWEETHPDLTSGSLSLTAGFCTTGAGPAADALGSVAVRLAEGAPFKPLLTDAPLSRLAKRDTLGTLMPC